MANLDELMKRAAATINDQAATIRQLRGDDSAVEGVLAKSALRRMGAPHAVDIIAAEVREGPNTKIGKARKQHGTETIAFMGENLGDRESVQKIKKSREAGGNPMNRF